MHRVNLHSSTFLSTVFFSNLLLITFLYAQPFDPYLNWQTLETKHFSIHFHNSEDDIVNEVAEIAEETYGKLTSFLEWKPNGKTHIVIIDNQDDSYGLANPFPLNTILISPVQPPPEQGYYDNWLRELIVHEFTHIVQIDKTGGFPGFLRKIFGRAIINNAAHPIWFIEGLAVYSESRFTNGGRLNSPRFSMILSKELESDNFKSIDRATNFPLVWPGYITPYLYGSAFLDWLEERYGPKSIVTYNNHTSQGIPLLVNSAAERTFGKDFLYLWKEWEKSLKQKQQKTYSAKSTPITDDGEWNLSPTFSPNGKFILFIKRNYDCYPSLVLYDIETKKYEKIVEGYINPGITWSDDGNKILFSKMDIYRTYYYYSQIYKYDIITEKLTGIKGTIRGKYPVYTPDGKGILFVKETGGENELCIAYPRNDSLEVLLHNQNFKQYYYPIFIPDSNRLILSIRKNNERIQIYSYSIATHSLNKLTQNGNNFNAVYSKSHNGLFFISDRTGEFNLMFLSLDEKKIYRLSSIQPGILYPQISSEEDELAFSLYTHNGYNIHTINIDELNFEETEPSKTDDKKLTFKTGGITSPVHSYNPLPYLIPKFWLPFPIIKENTVSPGIVTFSYDILMYNYIYLNFGYFIPHKNIIYDISYINSMFPFQMSLEVNNDFSLVLEKWLEEKERNIYFTLPKRYTVFNHYLTIGYEWEVNEFQTLSYKTYNYIAGYFCSNRLKFARSIEYERGGYLNINYRYYSMFNSMVYPFHNIKTQLGYYIKGFFSHDVLSISSSIGVSLSDTSSYGKIGIGGDSGAFSIRGYEKGVSYGKTAITGSVEYTFPLWYIEHGIRTFPIYFRNIHPTLFLDIGTTSNNFQPDDFHSPFISYGVETTLSLDLLYSQVPCNITGGVAVTKGKGLKKTHLYIKLTTLIPYLYSREYIIDKNM